MRVTQIIILWVVVAAGILALEWFAVSRLDRAYQYDAICEAQPNYYLAAPQPDIVFTILDGDKKSCRLLDAWPEAPMVMYNTARARGLDVALLPAISRAEGPTPKMLRHYNPYGLEISGRLMTFPSFDSATTYAASRLVKFQPRYQATGLVNIDSLAFIWCPLSRKLWADNMNKIYLKALICRLEEIKCRKK